MQIARKKHKSLTVNVERGNREPTERDFGIREKWENATNLERGEERAEIDRGRSGSLSLSLSRSLSVTLSLTVANGMKQTEE